MEKKDGTKELDEYEIKNLTRFIQVWGFLKYHHPYIAKGRYNWDNEFIIHLNEVIHLESKKSIDDFYTKFLQKYGKVNSKRIKNPKKNIELRNYDFSWMTDTSYFSNTLINNWNFILQNKYQGKLYYGKELNGGFNFQKKFKNENTYTDSIFPSPELKLLGLARYWNCIQYFYPYKYALDYTWESVLIEMTPKFYLVNDTISYHLAMKELVSKIQDSHGFFNTKYINDFIGRKFVPFYTKYVEEKIIVGGFYNDSIAKIFDIKIGDIIVEIDGIDVFDKIEARKKYVSYSNNAVLYRDIGLFLFNGGDDTTEIVFERLGVKYRKKIPRFSFMKFNYQFQKDTISYKLVNPTIGYIHMGNLAHNEIEPMLAYFQKTKGLIIDLRHYPNQTAFHLCYYLLDSVKPFAFTTKVDEKHLGTFIKISKYYVGSSKNWYSLRYTSIKKSAYKGKIVILVNENTQSQAEFSAMAFQTISNATIIGSQTAGADGNVFPICFPGNYLTYFSSIGIYYPDGRETQRIGIIPDIEVLPTINGISENKDELLDKAIEIININR